MVHQTQFDNALDTVERLDNAAQEELVAVLSRCLAERGRERVTSVVALSRREFVDGECRSMTAKEPVRKGQS
jgi:hypothetical protein